MVIQIPKAGALLPRECIQAQADHPEFRARANWYRFLRESHELTGAYAPVLDSYDTTTTPHRLLTSYLIPHEREDPIGYQWRIRGARPPMFVAEGIGITTGVLTYQKARRDGHPTKLDEWLRWVNPAGQDWRSFTSTEVVPMLERYGWTCVLVSPPPVSGRTEAEAKSAREAAGLPELVASVITPESIRAWDVDDSGQFVWMRYVEIVYSAGGPLDGGGRRIRRHWWLTRSGWWYADDLANYAEIELSGPDRADPQHLDASAPVQGDELQDASLGAGKPGMTSNDLRVGASGYWRSDKAELTRVPVSVWELPKRISPSHASALAQLDYYRVESELRNLEASTAFSQLWVPTSSDNTDPTAKVRGPAVIGTFPFDSRHVPMILSPDAGPLEHFMQRLDKLENAAYGAWGLRQDLSGSGTGIALSLIQERSTNLYRQHAEAITRGDVQTMEHAAEILGEELGDEFVCEYPTDFSSLTATAVMDNVLKFLETSPGRYFETRAKVEAARVLLPQLTEQDIQEGEAALEEQADKDEAQAEEWNDIEKMQATAPPVAPGGKPALDAKRARGGGGAERLNGQKG